MNNFELFIVNSIVFTILDAIGLGLTQLIQVDYPQFYERDPSISYYRLADDQVPAPEMYIINFVILAGIVFLCSFEFSPKYGDSTNYLPRVNWKTLFVLIIFAVNCPILTNFITEILKRTASEARPRALYDCCYAGFCDAVVSGNFTYYNQNTQEGTLGDISRCLNKSGIQDAFMSWPSGHASTSFVCMMACAILLVFTLGKYMPNKTQMLSVFGFLPYCMLVIAGWIAVTRVQDYKHRQSDIFCGATIGIAVAILLWKLAKPVLNEIEQENKERRKTINSDQEVRNVEIV